MSPHAARQQTYRTRRHWDLMSSRAIAAAVAHGLDSEPALIAAEIRDDAFRAHQAAQNELIAALAAV